MNFEIGKTYWAIHTGWGFDRISQVQLMKKKEQNGKAFFEAKETGKHIGSGVFGISQDNLFHSKADAEASREKKVEERVKELVAQTDTPEKMLNYLLDCIHRDTDGYVTWQAKLNLENRAREMFNLLVK